MYDDALRAQVAAGGKMRVWADGHDVISRMRGLLQWVGGTQNEASGGACLNSESGLMRFFRGIGMESIAWALRRLHCPVAPDALVLEVGSGGNPYAGAKVADAYEETRERHWAPLSPTARSCLGSSKISRFAITRSIS